MYWKRWQTITTRRRWGVSDKLKRRWEKTRKSWRYDQRAVKALQLSDMTKPLWDVNNSHSATSATNSSSFTRRQDRNRCGCRLLNWRCLYFTIQFSSVLDRMTRWKQNSVEFQQHLTWITDSSVLKEILKSDIGMSILSKKVQLDKLKLENGHFVTQLLKEWRWNKHILKEQSNVCGACSWRFDQVFHLSNKLSNSLTTLTVDILFISKQYVQLFRFVANNSVKAA